MSRLFPHAVLLFMSVVLLAAPSAATAQSEPFEPARAAVTPAVGLAFDPDADVSLSIAGAVAYPVAPAFVVEGELGHLFDMAPGDAGVDSSLTTVHASLLYVVQSEYLARPYLAGGLGIGRFSHELEVPQASIRSTEIGFNLGAGVMYPVAGDIWIRGDFRFFKHIDDVPSAWRFMGGIVLPLGD